MGRLYRIRLYANLSAPLQCLGNQGDMCFRDARASVFMKETFEVRFEPISSTTGTVKVMPTELEGSSKISIDCPAQGNSLVTGDHS